MGDHHIGRAVLGRRSFLGGAGAAVVAALVGTACAPKPTIDAARHTLRGLWDAIIPGSHAGVTQDWTSAGVPAPGAVQAGVQEWFEAASGTLPAPLDHITDWFLRAWAADLDLWADTFHLPIDGGPSFGDLPLGPSFSERGRQYKVMLMMKVFPGTLEMKYLLGALLAKVAFYGDFHAELTGSDPVGGPYIGFPGAVGEHPVAEFTYNRAFATADHRMVASPDGLVNAP